MFYKKFLTARRWFFKSPCSSTQMVFLSDVLLSRQKHGVTLQKCLLLIVQGI